MTDERKSVYDLPAYKPYKPLWEARVKELTRRSSYYDGSRYGRNESGINVLRSFYRAIPQVAGQIKSLYNPLSRAVDVDAGIIPGGWAFPDGAPDTWAPARDKLFSWSKWKTEGVLYVHYGAQYGITGLRVADLRQEGKIILQPVDPTTFLLIPKSQYDAGPAMSIMVQVKMDDEGAEYEYAEVITDSTILTYKNGEPQGFDLRDPEYTNENGFVPFVEAVHMKTGKRWGEATYEKAMAILDEANELATDLADVIKDNKDPQVVIFGAEPGELSKGKDTVWFVPDPRGRVEMLVPGINIEGILAFVKDVKKDLKDSLPELAFDELREKTQIATATLQIQLMELTLKIMRVRPNYDAGLVDALRMAGKMAVEMGIPEISVLDDDELSLNDERPVLPLDPKTMMELEMQEIALERERGMGISEGVNA